MKFTVQKSELLDKLIPAMGSVSNRNTITAIEGVLIEALATGEVQISTYDMNKGFRAILMAEDVERCGSYIINAQRLLQVVRSLSDDELTIEVNEKLGCNITSENSAFSMFAIDGKEFPNLPDLITERGFTVSGSIFKNMISKVQHSIADQDTRPMLCGAYFKIDKNGIEAVSCDSYTLSKCNMKCEVNSITSDNDAVYSFIIPGHAIGELSKILGEGDEDTVKIYLSRKHAIFKKENIVFFTRTIDLEYIDYNKIIPKNNSIKVILDRERLLSGLERANIIADERIQGSGRRYVKVSIDHYNLDLESTSANGSVRDTMACQHEGREIVIGFNCRYLINSIRAAEGENIRITMSGPTRAITIEPAEELDDFNYYYMILPVRMNEQK